MENLTVLMSDLYGKAMTTIEVPELTKEAILACIEQNYHELRNQIQGIMGGVVVVYRQYPGPEVARGNIVYWGLPGGHSIRLELKQAV